MEKSFDDNEKNSSDLETYSKCQCCRTFFFCVSETKRVGLFSIFFISFFLINKRSGKSFDDNEKNCTYRETNSKQ